MSTLLLVVSAWVLGIHDVAQEGFEEFFQEISDAMLTGNWVDTPPSTEQHPVMDQKHQVMCQS